jgi:CDP-6-deoxy-D-xylo-4-hexulose-3-dehydrase
VFEGGMICTDDKKIYEIVKILRSHGMARESNNPIFEKRIIKKYPKLYSKFIFLYPGYNFRNNEVGGVIGLSQLKSLDKNNKRRKENLSFFLKLLDKSKYRTDFQLKGSCNYAFPVILKKKNLKSRNLFEKVLLRNKIDFRRGNAGGGNQLRQPYLQKYTTNINLSDFKEVDHIHFFGYYIGNYPSLSEAKIKKICNILNHIKI